MPRQARREPLTQGVRAPQAKANALLQNPARASTRSRPRGSGESGSEAPARGGGTPGGISSHTGTRCPKTDQQTLSVAFAALSVHPLGQVVAGLKGGGDLR